jgi:hypothetical protein
MMELIERVRRLFGDRSAAAQSYEDARAGLNGGLCRELPENLESWFISDIPPSNDAEPAE